MRILHEACDVTKENTKELPNSAYVIEYMKDGIKCFDIAMSGKQVEIFDEYYDKYKKDLVNITQAEGRISPKLWNPPGTKKEK